MKDVLLTRQRTSSQGTFGELSIDGLYFKTGELPDKGNASGLSCIPPGEYDVAWQESPKFGEVYTLQDVPGRSHILIHSGNLCGDVQRGYKSDVEGCILLGHSVGLLNGQEAVISSKSALDDFQDYMKREPFHLKIVDEYPETGTSQATIV